MATTAPGIMCTFKEVKRGKEIVLRKAKISHRTPSRLKLITLARIVLYGPPSFKEGWKN